MDILLVNYEYKGQGGGAGQGTYNMARAFREMGHTVSILTGWDYRFGSPEIIDGVTTHIIKYRKKNIQLSTPLGLLSFVIKGIPRINRITRKHRYDIIQFYFSVPTGILKCGIHGRVPYVASLRGMDIPGLQKNRYSAFSFLTAALNRAVTRGAAAVTCLSREAAAVYNTFSPDISISVIPNAVNYDAYAVKKEYSDRVARFVTMSRLVSWKRLDLLIDAVSLLYKKYPWISLDIYGQGYLSEELNKRIASNGAEGFIAIKGYEDMTALAGTLHEYDAFALMSTGDSFGLVFIEAMSAGLPVLAARAGGPIEIVSEGHTGIFASPDDLDDTVQKLEYCITHPERMAEFGKQGRKRVEKLYSIESVARRHLDLYERVMHDGAKKLFH